VGNILSATAGGSSRFNDCGGIVRGTREFFWILALISLTHRFSGVLMLRRDTETVSNGFQACFFPLRTVSTTAGGSAQLVEITRATNWPGWCDDKTVENGFC
jgi:hypothetical protein